jgi:hypothetical protein
MPYKILKRGSEYVLKSESGREYKHKTLAKARAQKRLLEQKEAGVVQKQTVKQTQRVVVNINQPRARKRGAPARSGVARPDKAPLAPRITMLPAALPSAQQIAYEMQVLNRVSSAPRVDMFENRQERDSNLIFRPEPPRAPPLNPREHYFDFEPRFEHMETPLEVLLDPSRFLPREQRADVADDDESRRRILSSLTKNELKNKIGDRSGISGLSKNQLIELIIREKIMF